MTTVPTPENTNTRRGLPTRLRAAPGYFLLTSRSDITSSWLSLRGTDRPAAMAAASYAAPKANRLRFAASTAITACLGGPSNGLTPIRINLETSPRATTVVKLRQSVIRRCSAVKAIEELVRYSKIHPTTAAPRIAISSKPIGSSHEDVARRLSTTRRTAIGSPMTRALRARSRSRPPTVVTVGRKLVTTEPWSPMFRARLTQRPLLAFRICAC
jgi:hypothetical protein